jgi:hypothetical protein
MTIRPLTQQDACAYLAYRREMWPHSSAAGDWETICIKYFQNPLAELCPGTGLYGYFDGDALLGIWGAYPMPVTLNGSLYPGHVLVDSFVLNRCQNLPIGGLLFRTVQNLPGRKYASHGTRPLQEQLARIASRIECTASLAIWKFLPAAAFKLLGLAGCMQPSPVSLERTELAPGVRVAHADELLPDEPAEAATTAFVRRDSGFWKYYCSQRVKNGAVPLQIRTANAEAQVVIRVEAAGRIAMASFMSLRLAPYTTPAAREVGFALRKALSALGICAANATESDDVLRALQDALGIHVRRSGVYWWSIPRKSDTFASSSVGWRLTLADRDSHWGAIPPSRQFEL